MSNNASNELILDIGSNSGQFAIEIAKRNPSRTILAFEPIPELADGISEKSKAFGLANVKVFKVAIDNSPRTDKLNISNQGDQGISSLLQLDRQTINKDDYWATRIDLEFNSSIPVQVVRLDSIFEIKDASRICFLKIDAQGLDIAALESLGTHMSNLEAGMLEVPATLESKLYTNEEIDLFECFKKLNDLGFKIYNIKPNDPASREFNVYFCRKSLDWRSIEADVHLVGLNLYDGKHFWHNPSNQLQTEFLWLPKDGFSGKLVQIIERLRNFYRP